MALPKPYEASRGFGATSTTGDPEGEIAETGRVPAGDAGAADRRDPPAPAGATRRSRSTASAPTARAARRGRSSCPSGCDGPRFERALARDGDRARGFAIDCSSGTYVRSLIADLGDAYCLELRRTAIGPFDVADATAPSASARLASCRAAVG